MTQDILKIEGLELEYPTSRFKLGPLSLAIKPKQVIGILGQNGAGKSTLFQMLTGNIRPDSGEVRIKDQLMRPDRPEVKRLVGYLPQALELPKWVNGQELLSYAIKLYQLDRADERRSEALSYWDSTHFAHKPLAACSHGMQKRIGLALATIHEPDLLILDEPFSGLDLYHIRSLQEMIRYRRERGQVTILSTHIAPYAAELCDEVTLIKSGQFHHLGRWGETELLPRIQMIENFFFPSKKVMA